MSTANPLVIDDRWGPQLAAMSIAEKEALLNLLLIDLAQVPQGVQPQDWPFELLQERKRAVEEGRMQLKDWEVAKQDILDRVKRK